MRGRELPWSTECRGRAHRARLTYRHGPRSPVPLGVPAPFLRPEMPMEEVPGVGGGRVREQGSEGALRPQAQARPQAQCRPQH